MTEHEHDVPMFSERDLARFVQYAQEEIAKIPGMDLVVTMQAGADLSGPLGCAVERLRDSKSIDTAACTCSGTSEDRGGGYFELMLEPEPGCPEHGADIAARTADVHVKIRELLEEAARWPNPDPAHPTHMARAPGDIIGRLRTALTEAVYPPSIAPIAPAEVAFSHLEYGLAPEDDNEGGALGPVFSLSTDLADPEELQRWIPTATVVERRVTVSEWVRCEEGNPPAASRGEIDEEALADVLREHGWYEFTNRCECGEIPVDMDTHRAAKVAEHVRGESDGRA